MNRRLKKEELIHGMFVQCEEPGLTSIHPTIYQIIIRDGEYFYKTAGYKCLSPGDMITDIWWETEKTKSMNRDKKLKELGIDNI